MGGGGTKLHGDGGTDSGGDHGAMRCELYTCNLCSLTPQCQPSASDLKTKEMARVLAAALQAGARPGLPENLGDADAPLPPTCWGRGGQSAPTIHTWARGVGASLPPSSPARSPVPAAGLPRAGTGHLHGEGRADLALEAPALSPSARFFQSFSEGQVWTVAQGTVRQQIWGRNQAIVPFLRREWFLLISACPKFCYLNVPSQEQQMRTF